VIAIKGLAKMHDNRIHRSIAVTPYGHNGQYELFSLDSSNVEIFKEVWTSGGLRGIGSDWSDGRCHIIIGVPRYLFEAQLQ
jgi:hypothetical protein